MIAASKSDRKASVVASRPSRAASGMLQRQCACAAASSPGSCSECRKRHLQRKLSIGATHDPLEAEADRIADQVLTAPASVSFSRVSADAQRKTEVADETASEAPDSVDRALSSAGKPMDPSLRVDMERRFGHDFSQVRVHADADASLSAQDVNAQAYTVGRHLVFGAGRYAPTTHQGQRLLAHELAHVLQQTGGDPLASGNNTRSAVSASSISTAALTVQRQPNDEPISLHSSYNPGAHAYDDLVTEAGKIHHWLQKHPATSPERTALETQLAQIIQTANRLGQRMGYAPLTFVDLTPASKSPEQVDGLNKLNSLSQPQTPSPFLQAPKASAPPEHKPAAPVTMPAYLNWQPLFLEGLSAGLQSDAKLQAGWATLKAQLAEPGGKLSFAGGSAAGIVPGAVVAVVDIPYSLLKAYVEFGLQTNFGHVTKEQFDKAIEEVTAGIKKFVARIPELVSEVANEPKQVGGWAAELISEKIREDLFLEEPDKKAPADNASKTDKSTDPFGLAGIKLPDLYKLSQDLLMRGKPGEKGRFIFNKGVACGMALGYTLMNIAMLFIGPEEMAGKAASIGAKGLEALKAGGLWRRLGTIAESIPELKGLLSAKRAATEAKAVAAATKEGEALAGVAKAAGGEASLGKLEADAVAVVDKNPGLVTGEPGHRHARISPEHEIVEVPTAGGGVGCELHSPSPFPKVPCPKGMGKAQGPAAKPAALSGPSDATVQPDGLRIHLSERRAERLTRAEQAEKWTDLPGTDRTSLGKAYNTIVETVTRELASGGRATVLHYQSVSKAAVDELAKKGGRVLITEGRLPSGARFDIAEIDFRAGTVDLLDLTAMKSGPHTGKTGDYAAELQKLTGFPVSSYEARYVDSGAKLADEIMFVKAGK